MDYKNYTQAGEWYKDALKAGYSVNTAMMHAITGTMEKLNMSFPEAFAFLEEHRKIILEGKVYVFDLSYEK